MENSPEEVEAAMEEVPLMASVPTESPEQGASGTCRICLETAPMEELEEACACKGSLQRVHHACLQRWIDERDLPRNNTGALVCEVCKTPYIEGYRPPPPRPVAATMPPRRVERVQIGQDVYVIVVDSQTGERLGTARPIRGLSEYEDDDDEEYSPRHLNPVSACAISFFLFMMSSLLLSNLFTSLPETSTGGDPSGSSGDIPSPMDDDQADQQFQDVSMQLLLLWLMLRLLVLVAPVYTISRMFERARNNRASVELGSVEAVPAVGVVAHNNT